MLCVIFLVLCLYYINSNGMFVVLVLNVILPCDINFIFNFILRHLYFVQCRSVFVLKECVSVRNLANYYCFPSL